MQLEAGKSYHTERGELIGPMQVWTDHVMHVGDDRRWNTSTGHQMPPLRLSKPPQDLVLEYGGQPEGRKDDGGKPPLHLIAPDFLYAIAEILDFGAKKYAPRNWEKGMDWSRVYRAAVGHLFDWFMRKGPDPETGKSHLWHAACCIMFLVVYEIRGVGKDDRP